MSSTVLAYGMATIGGMSTTYLVTIVASIFLLAAVGFFAAVALGPHLKPSSLSEQQKSALIGLGAAAVGATWMVAILRAAYATAPH
ncbi:hypothetical protein [Halovivax limisalsi]|uniref:hypothetical protein n=1 Tax=Halovivax limisalsi TaxID=1453760 RepID=UPI001FFC4203|nr:hypothetical protein [Halovivax limisalsi]